MEQYQPQVTVIIGRHDYNRQESGSGYLSIWGELVNEGNVSIYTPGVTITCYDGENNVIALDVTGTSSLMTCLAPQGRAPFHYTSYGPARQMDRIVRHEIVPTFTTSSNGWEPLAFEERDTGPIYRDVVVSNPYDYDFQGIRLIVTTYDETGRVYEAQPDFVGNKIYSGGQWTFHLQVPTRTYRLQAEGRRT